MTDGVPRHVSNDQVPQESERTPIEALSPDLVGEQNSSGNNIDKVDGEHRKDDRPGVDDGVVGDPPIKGGVNNTTSALTPVSASVLRANYKKVKWIVDGVVPEGGIVLFVGQPGIGKTWLMLALALDVALAQQWLGRFACKSGRVLIILEEDDPNAIVERLDLLYAGMDLPKEKGDELEIGYLIQAGVSLLTSKDKKLNPKLEIVMREYKPSLIIIDPFRRVHGEEENDSAAMSNLFKELRQLTGFTDPPCAVVMNHHDRKGFGSSGRRLDGVRGSTDIAGSVDGVLEISGVFEEGLTINHSKSKRGPCQGEFDVLPFVCEDYVRLVAADHKDKAAKQSDNEEEACKAVRKALTGGPLNQSKLFKACSDNLGVGRDRVEKACEKLINENELAVTKNGRSKLYELVVGGDMGTINNKVTGILPMNLEEDKVRKMTARDCIDDTE